MYRDQIGKRTVRAMGLHMGEEHNYFGIDYFLFRTGSESFPTLPPFLVGRIRWDNFIVANCIRSRNFETIDSSNAVLALHQNHAKSYASHNRPGREVNEELAKGVDFNLGHIKNTFWSIEREREPWEWVTRHQQHRNMMDCNIENNGKGTSVEETCRFERRAQSLDILLWKHAEKSNIIVLTAECSDDQFINEWVDKLKRSKIHHYLIHCVDQKGFDSLLWNTRLPVFFLNPSDISKGLKNNGLWPTPSKAGVLVARLALMHEILRQGTYLFCQ